MSWFDAIMNWFVRPPPSPAMGPMGDRRVSGGPFPAPLRVVVARLLDEWGVDSDTDETEDDFCDWRVGSRAAAELSRSRRGSPATGASYRVRDGGQPLQRPSAAAEAAAKRATAEVDAGPPSSWSRGGTYAYCAHQ